VVSTNPTSSLPQGVLQDLQCTQQQKKVAARTPINRLQQARWQIIRYAAVSTPQQVLLLHLFLRTKQPRLGA